ncbi:heavy metal response regulator transcription factor [Granulosicoccus sp. 3-233]|uniref:heavy metal response regulator transcription factor n=1 Tax=Granulosicoccus sp. 3-233 TaxID=3417969 RepID=UPI003D34B295
MKLLIVEDELKLAQYLRDGLSSEGFVVDVASDGLEGLQLALEYEYDAIVLDRMLPGLDGMAILSALRSKKTTPVLMLTAVDGVEDRVDGLKSGADDYLVKPFAFSELVARLQVITRRGMASIEQKTQTGKLHLADLEVDLVRRKASRGGKALELTAKEFVLLTLLLRRQGEVLSRAVLADQVWDMNFDSGTNVVEVAIRRLRTKLDVPFEHALLHTERGMGYVLEDRSTQ